VGDRTFRVRGRRCDKFSRMIRMIQTVGEYYIYRDIFYYFTSRLDHPV
jgi:hypothetical protein